jgi:hypothetical protein
VLAPCRQAALSDDRVLAQRVGDEETTRLATSIRADEQRMLERILREIPELTDAVVGAEVQGDPSYDVTTTGAADTVRDVGRAARRQDDEDGCERRADRAAGPQGAGGRSREGQVKGAVASEDDLAIARYDTLTADEITAKLPELSQVDPRRSTPTSAGPEPHHDPQSPAAAARRRAVAGL